MGTVTDRIRAVYLLLLIFFLIGVGFFVFDYYQIIDAEEYFPFLAKKPALVNWNKESPTEVEILEVKKARERLEEEKEEIEKLRKELDDEKVKIDAEKTTVEEIKKGIREKELDLAAKEKERENRQQKIKILANKVANMPPTDARDMLVNWPDQDIIDVFTQMDKDAEEEGRQTITTYLLTLFDAKRRSVISNKWLDSDANKIPRETNIDKLLQESAKAGQ